MKTSDLTRSTTLFEIDGVHFVSHQQLRDWLPDTEAALWFAKLFKLSYSKTSELLSLLFKSSVMDALMAGDHSLELQSWLDEFVPEHVWDAMEECDKPAFVDQPAPGEVLPELWKSAQIEIARSIQEVGDKLANTLAMLPSKEGRMTFESLAKFNRQRPSIGQYVAHIQHQAVPDVLVILDVSGSMTESTIRTIVGDVVDLAWQANAHLAIVSNSCFHWEPGSFTVEDVLAKAEYGGTMYGQLAPLFEKDWGTVITIADYDSYGVAKKTIAAQPGRVGEVLDISLVDKPTFLAECVGTRADKVTPLMIATGVM